MTEGFLRGRFLALSNAENTNDPMPGDPDYCIDVSDRPLPPGTPVNDQGKPIFVMTDEGDLNWPRSVIPADPDDPTQPLYDDDHPD
ncbi:MAG TPA: hypothetical protein VG815_05350 [Chloroflexota bacterium]|jgi:hypothetical protein|nr:hypothetical protein [Chloroflexota bacterium]